MSLAGRKLTFRSGLCACELRLSWILSCCQILIRLFGKIEYLLTVNSNL